MDERTDEWITDGMDEEMNRFWMTESVEPDGNLSKNTG